MLSRVAESLYWTGRYIERAEDTSRLLHANFHGLLDTDLDRGRAWRDLIWVVGQDELFREHFSDYTAPAVTEFLLWHPANPDAVTSCIARARENARGVREQVSSEMWEHLNRLHLLVSNRRPAAVLASPHDFFVRVREGSHAFQGVMKATQPRGEAYEFLELGGHLERADTTARLLSVKVPGLRAEEPAAVVGARLTSLLKSCGAFEAYRRMESDELRAERVVSFLLLERRLPRAVCFCLELCLSAIRAISGGGARPERAIGRVFAELAFTELYGLDESTDLLLARVRHGISDAADEIASSYFTTRVIPPGPYAAAQHQQQQ
ncbi:MAG TPA: alpha-E domain-containing protein [Gaiellaceae bacterium]|nr:alpha-E domain-containing protein [Gaiellaceae bacterium]